MSIKSSQEVAKFTGYQIFVVALLAALQFTEVMGFSIMFSLGDILMKSLSMDTAQFGLIVSCYAFGAGIAGILATSFADKFDRKKFLLFFYTGFIAGMLLCGLSDSYAMLLVAICIAGAFGGVIASISFAIVSDLFALNQRGRVMGFVQMAFTVSQIAGIPAGLFIANRWGWNATFFTIATLAAVACVAAALKLRPITEHRKLQTSENPLKRFWHVLSNKDYRLGYVFVTILTTGSSMLMPFTAIFLINNAGVTQSRLPLVFLFTGVAMTIMMPLVGKLSDKFAKSNIFIIGAIFNIVITIIYTHLTPVSFWWVTVINALVFASVASRMVPAFALNTAVPDPKDRGAYLSLCSALQQMSNGIAALIAGWIVVQHAAASPLERFDLLGYIAVAMGAICMFLIVRINKIVKRKEALRQQESAIVKE
jgi:predicted MFS family arabinose efflux permease